MTQKEKISDNVLRLPRGGFLIDTPAGYVQFGSPPETIKDTMEMEKGVPQIFVLTDILFNWIKGISLSEIEFPIYYNYWFKRKKTYIICGREQFPRVQKVLHESLFGPREIDIAEDFSARRSELPLPDLRKEINYFRNNLKLSDYVAFGIFNEKNRFTFQGITIEKIPENGFSVYFEKNKIADVPGAIEYKATYEIGERLPEPYKPPLFGVTCLGPSHGFDPKENTSGYIIWLNHLGIMVDPPVNSTEWLQDSNVNPKLIDSIILTHCHADHDAGTFQKILEEGKITIYTTQTIMMSFLRKYSSLTNVSIEYLMKLFEFHPIKVGTPVYIHDGEFHMFYSLHSIPTVGFKMEFQNQTFVYSSDHNNDPEVHKKLLDIGAVSKERYEELRNFPFDSKVIYHESGVAPLHTPIAILNSLPEDVQKRTVVYHIAKKDFPADTSLTLAKFGIENTLYFETQPPVFETAYQILGILKNLDFFQGLPIGKAQEFINIVEERHYKKGERIIKKGTRGDEFYIIFSGNVSVDSGGLEERKIYGTYDYFGEVAIMTGRERAADVVTETDVVLYAISGDKFRNFISGTDFEKTLERLIIIRSSETWNLLSTSKLFHHCTASQKTWLESIFIPREVSRHGVLLEEGHTPDYIYIIRDGEVVASKKGKRISVLRKGDFIGQLKDIHTSAPSEYTFTHNSHVALFAMKKEDILRFVDKNPGLLMKLVYEF